MNILYVVNSDPRETLGGMQQRTNYLYRALQKVGSVYVVVCERAEADAVDGRIAMTEIGLPRNLLARLINWCYYIARHFLKIWMVLRAYPFPSDFNPGRIFPGVKFDLVVARYFTQAAVPFAWRFSNRLIVDMDDDPLAIFNTYVRQQIHPFLRGLSRIVLEWELRIFGRHFDGVWYSNRDQMANYFRSDTKIVELPNLPPEVSSLYRCDSVRDNMLMTVGAFGYMPNTYGIDRFLSDVWPIVKAEFPDMKYLIVGRGVSDFYRAKWAQVAGVTIMGYVDDLDSIYSRALASVVPIDQGGGTCIKTLDSLAHSRICLSTTYGSRGIPPDDLRNGNNGICVYETADQFVTSLKKIVYDLPWRVERESAARTYIENNYSQERFCSKVSQLIMSVKGKVASA